MSKLFNIKKVHIEISSKCTLKCPRCPRTELQPEQLNQEFTLKEFTNAFPVNVLNQIDKIVFCGDVGDPIYANDLLDIIKYIKQTSCKILIITNGSYKKIHWWHELALLLSASDTVQFSVDGWDDYSNNLYRINSDYSSIIQGIITLRKNSSCMIRWSSIYFSFNENHMDKILQAATQLGIDEWQGVLSTKFDGRYLVDNIDKLKPLDISKVSHNGLYQKINVVLKRNIDQDPDYSKSVHPWAKCLNFRKELFVNVEGLLFPCPWFNNGYQTNEFVQQNKSKLSIKSRSIFDVINDNIWQEFVNILNNNPLEICKIKCQNDR